ncbi:hypothetical protein LBMAG53_21780 [Planctomycetota bacterium]|nr:hypothetical protein LBMAG53_21780 [Planctomycetota bacterium]
MIPITLININKNIAYHLKEDDTGNIIFGGILKSIVRGNENVVLHKFLTIPKGLMGNIDYDLELVYNITMEGNMQYEFSDNTIDVKFFNGEFTELWPDENYPKYFPEKKFTINDTFEFNDINVLYDAELYQGIDFAVHPDDMKYFTHKTSKGNDYRCLAIVRNIISIDSKRNIWCDDNPFINIVWVRNIINNSIQAYNEC